MTNQREIIKKRKIWENLGSENRFDELVEVADLIIKDQVRPLISFYSEERQQKLKQIEENILEYPLIFHYRLIESLSEVVDRIRASLRVISPQQAEYKTAFQRVVWLEFRILNQQKRIQQKMNELIRINQ